MNEKDIIREALKTVGWSQRILAEKMGSNSQSFVGNRLQGKSMRVNTFVKMLSLMGYEVVVRSTSRNSNKNQWVVISEDNE